MGGPFLPVGADLPGRMPDPYFFQPRRTAVHPGYVPVAGGRRPLTTAILRWTVTF